MLWSQNIRTPGTDVHVEKSVEWCGDKKGLKIRWSVTMTSDMEKDPLLSPRNSKDRFTATTYCELPTRFVRRKICDGITTISFLEKCIANQSWNDIYDGLMTILSDTYHMFFLCSFIVDKQSFNPNNITASTQHTE